MNKEENIKEKNRERERESKKGFRYM